MTDPRAYTPLVRKLAAEHGVDLAAVNGTGIGGRVTKLDVLAAGAWPSAIAAAVTRGAITPARAPAFEAMAAENPRAMLALLDQIPSGASMVTTGRASGSSPLPAMTASGMDPKLLTRVPTCARLAIAAAATLPEAFALMRSYEGMDEVEARERLLLDPRIQSGWLGESPLVELPPSEAVPTGEATGWFSDAEIGPRASASYLRGADEL